MDENRHLEQFDGKCSRLISEKTYRDYYRGKDCIGFNPSANDPYGSMYVSTVADIDKAIKGCNGDISKLESSLGFPEGHFGNGPVVRVDINNPEEHGLRVANGKEAGANEYFNTKADQNGNLPKIEHTTTSDGRWAVDANKTDSEELAKLNGQYIDQNGAYHPPNTAGYDGKTSGGMSEAVINQVPNNAENVSYTKIEGFKRNENNTLNTTRLYDGYSNNNTTSKINSQTVAAEKGGGANAPNQKNGPLPEQKSSQPDRQEPLNTNGRKPEASEAVKNTNKTDRAICGTTPGNPPKEPFDPKIEKPAGLATENGMEGAYTAKNESAADQTFVPVGPI